MPNRPELQTKVDRFGNRISNHGVMRAVRFAKFSEAEERNAKTDLENKRSTWRARGFNRKSHAAMVVRETVREANAMADAVRARSGQDDWAENFALDLDRINTFDPEWSDAENR